MLVLLIIISGAHATVIDGVDIDIKDCSKPFTLSFPTPQRFDMRTINVSAKVDRMVSPQLFYSIRVTKMQAECPDWFTETFSTKCTKRSTVIKYNKEQVRKMAENEGCWVGRECLEGECTSANVKYCEDDIFDRYTTGRAQVIPKEEITAFRYTCNVEWDCNFLKKQKPIYADSLKLSFYFYGEENNKIYLRDGQDVYIENGWHYFVTQPNVKRSNETLGCLKSTNRVICKYQSNPPEYVIINNHFVGEDKSTIVTIKGDIWTQDQNSISGDATIEQVRRLLTKLEEENLQSNYNFIQISSRIESLENFVTNLIKHERSEDVLSAVIKRPNVKVIRLRDGYFTACALTKKDAKESLTEPFPNISKILLFKHLELNMGEVSNSIVLDDRYSEALYNLKQEIDRGEDNVESKPKINDNETGLIPSLYETLVHYVHTFGSFCGVASLFILIFRR